MSDDIVARLREGTFGTDETKTDCVLNAHMARAADEIERLRAERDALRELLREAREYTGCAAFYGDRIEADHAVDLCARIDAALNKGGKDE